jgi:hypothetical protein
LIIEAPAHGGGAVTVTVKPGIWPEIKLTLSASEAALIAGALEISALEATAS